MQALAKNFPQLVCLPGRYKFPNVSAWQNRKSTSNSRAEWKNAKQIMCLCGKVSGVTVVDVDDDLDFWQKLVERYDIPKTTTVRTPSGGLHLYYKYDPLVKTTTNMWGNKKGKGKIAIDIRNDRGVTALPGSIYEIREKDKEKKAHKLKYCGTTYKFERDGERLMDFSCLAPMPAVIRDIRRWGINKETLEIMVPTPKFRKYQDITAGNSELTPEMLIELLKAVQAEGQYKGEKNRQEWLKVCYTACAICHVSGYPEKCFEIVNAFSAAGEGYDGEEPVRHVVSSFAPQRFPVDNPLSYLLGVFLPKNSPTRAAFLRNVKVQYCYLDYANFQGLCKLEEVEEYIRQAFRVVDRGGDPQFYLRYYDIHGLDDWRPYSDSVPFGKSYTRCHFSYLLESTNERGEKETK